MAVVGRRIRLEGPGEGSRPCARCGAPSAAESLHTVYPENRSRPRPRTVHRPLCPRHAPEYAVAHELVRELEAQLERARR